MHIMITDHDVHENFQVVDHWSASFTNISTDKLVDTFQSLVIAEDVACKVILTFSFSVVMNPC